MTRFNLLSIFFYFSLAFIACKKEPQIISPVEKLASNINEPLRKVVFINKVGYVIGGNTTATILVSTDNGNTWQTKIFPEVGSGLLAIAHKYDDLGIYAIGSNGKMVYTADNAQSWHFMNTSISRTIEDMAFFEPKSCIFIGSSGQGGFRNYINDESGNEYVQQNLDYTLHDIEMLNNKTGFVCGNGRIEKTDDGAVSWQALNISNDDFRAMHIKTINEIWLCGYKGGIYYTSDGGQTWQTQRGKESNQLHLTDIFFMNDHDGWAIGEGGAILYTKNGGSDWYQYEKITTENLLSITEAPDANLIVCGENGGVYRIKS
ncbi:MAG: hypothetical protein EOP51_12100 [Sphingobacteriales bacterium]|nr:MAG: hypothetical protein EOP51_12100 [Sphingobacteriales bacterium]